MTVNRRTVLLGLSCAALVSTSRSGAAKGPAVVVSKDPNCGCCVGWVEHLRSADFTVDVRDVSDLAPVKARLGVPEELASCHKCGMLHR